MFRPKCHLSKTIAMITLGQLMFTAFLQPAQAEQVLKSPQDPLKVKLNTGIEVGKTQYGDAFSGTLTENHRYQDKLLPAGTVIAGQVHTTRQSHMFAMPGYVTMDIKSVTLPNGEEIQLNLKEKDQHTQKIMHPEAITVKRSVKLATPFALISAADAIPLKYAAGFSSWTIVPISLGARMLLGAALEKTESEKKKHAAKNHSTTRRVSHGLFRGTGIPGAYLFIKPSPEPTVAAGDVIPIQLEKSGIETIFANGLQAEIVNNTNDGLKPLDSDFQEFSTVQPKLNKSASKTPPVTATPINSEANTTPPTAAQ